MPLNREFIGHVSGSRVIDVDKTQLCVFAKAIGETNPIFFDEEAAKARGYPSIVAPPTYGFCLRWMAPPKDQSLEALGFTYERLLHGEESFTYHRTIHAGDTLSFQTRIVDMYEKKGGALEFMVTETTAHNQHGDLVETGRSVVIMRNG